MGAEDSLKFDADSYEAEAGCVEVTYTNEGSTAHNLLIEGKSGFKLSVGDIDTGTVELAGGQLRALLRRRRPRGRRHGRPTSPSRAERARPYAGRRSSQPTK